MGTKIPNPPQPTIIKQRIIKEGAEKGTVNPPPPANVVPPPPPPPPPPKKRDL
jgi:hypothetical protein